MAEGCVTQGSRQCLRGHPAVCPGAVFVQWSVNWGGDSKQAVDTSPASCSEAGEEN